MAQMPELTNTVRQHRRAKDMTQAELGDALTVPISRQAVAAIETGRFKPGVETAINLAQALGTTVEELFFYEHTEHPV